MPLRWRALHRHPAGRAAHGAPLHLLASYRFNTATAEHFFCSRCGIYTHHQRRSNPRQYGVNVACLDGISPFDFPEVPVIDGEHHPSDHRGTVRRVGTLRFAADTPDAPSADG